jgi:hypothetical protein
MEFGMPEISPKHTILFFLASKFPDLEFEPRPIARGGNELGAVSFLRSRESHL